MNYNVLLVSEQKVKDSTPIQINAESSEIRYAIQQAQSIFLQESLGTQFLEEIFDQVETGTLTVVNEEFLRNFAIPMLIAYTYYIYLDSAFVKIINIGAQQMRSEQGQPIGLKEFSYLKDQARERAQFLDNLLRRHLVFKSYLYPAYTNFNASNGQLLPEFTGQFKTSITLPSSAYSYRDYSYGTPFDCPYPWWYGGKGSGE